MTNSTFEEELLGFYKECYYSELDRKDKIRQQLGLTVAALAILCNIVSYYFANFKFHLFIYPHLYFYVPFIFGILSAIMAFIYLICYFSPDKGYAYIPTAKDVRDTINTINEVMEQSKSEDPVRPVRDFYIKNLSEQYSECATHNRKNNTKRTGYVFSSLKSSMISILFLLLAFPGFFYFQRESPAHNSKHVEVLTMSKQQSSPDNPNNSGANASQDQQDQQDQAPDSAEASLDTSAINVPWPQVEYIKEADEKNAE